MNEEQRGSVTAANDKAYRKLDELLKPGAVDPFYITITVHHPGDDNPKVEEAGEEEP